MAQLWCKVFPHKIYQIDDLYTQLHISPDHTQFNTLNQMIFLALISNTLYFSKPTHKQVFLLFRPHLWSRQGTCYALVTGSRALSALRQYLL